MDNSTVLSDVNVTFSYYSLQINEGTKGLVQVYSITAGCAISPGSANVNFPKEGE